MDIRNIMFYIEFGGLIGVDTSYWKSLSLSKPNSMFANNHNRVSEKRNGKVDFLGNPLEVMFFRVFAFCPVILSNKERIVLQCFYFINFEKLIEGNQNKEE